MSQNKRTRPAWLLFLIILLLGICCMLGAGQFATQLSPTWDLIADVDSNINPNDQLVKWSNSPQLVPVGPGILTQPAWKDVFLTPGASIFSPPIVFGIPTATPPESDTPLPPGATQEPGSSVTPAQPTAVNSATPVVIVPQTSTPVVPNTDIPTKVPPSGPSPTSTVTRTVTTTTTATVTILAGTPTVTPTRTQTVTATSTLVSGTNTATPTTTQTVTPTSTLVVGTDTATPTTTVTVTVDVPPSCDNNIYISEPPIPTRTYSLVSGVINCLVYSNSDTTKYIQGGTFTITNNTGSNRTFHYTCGGSSRSVNISNENTGFMSVSRDGNDMIVKIAGGGSGSVDVAVAEWNSGSCTSGYQPQPRWTVGSFGLIIVAALFVVLWKGISSVRL